MGLNVYFCDVCGVRVTDVDLRSGHGMLRGHDVICATCLEMGHGKEWLASRGVPAEAAVHAAANGSSPRPSSSSAAVLDHARDRAATVDDTDPRLPTADHEDTRQVQVQDANFAGAAAGFAALSAPEPQAVDDADGALDEESSDEVDPALLKTTDSLRATDEHPAAAAEPVDDDDSSALISAKDRERGSSSKSRGRSDRLRRSVSGSRAGSVPSKPAGKKSSSSVQAAKSSGSGKIAKPKSSSTKSGRKPSGGGGGMPLPLKVSLITVPLILIIMALYVGPKVVGSSARPVVKDMQAEKSQVERSYKETTAAINSAVSSKDLAVLKAAQASWLKLNDDFATFESSAKANSGWTETNCEAYRESLKFADLGARMKIIRDEIAKQSVR